MVASPQSHHSFHIRQMAATNQLLSEIRSSTVTDIRHRVPFWSPRFIKTSSVAWGITTVISVNMTEMDWWVGCFRCSKLLTDCGLFHCTSWIRPMPTLVVNVEPLSHWPGSMCSQPRLLESGFRSILFLWRTFKDCHTLWTIVQTQNFSVVCQPYIWLIRRLLPGSSCRAYTKKIWVSFAFSMWH